MGTLLVAFLSVDKLGLGGVPKARRLGLSLASDGKGTYIVY